MSRGPNSGRPRRRRLSFLLVLGALLVAGAGRVAAAPAQQAEEQAPELPTVVSIAVTGAVRYRDDELVRALGQPVGEPLDPAAIDAGIRNLWDSLKVRASVQFREVPGGVELRLEVHEMAFDLEPRFVGNKEFDRKKLEEWAMISGREELFLFQARTVRRRILEHYHKEGYYWAEVNVVSRGEVVEGDEPVTPDVIFEIKEGPKVRVQDVVIRGNQSLPDKGMLFWAEGLGRYSHRKLHGANWFKFRFLGSKFVEEELEADLQAMRQAYRDRGWLDVVVETEELRFNKKRDRVTIVVRIDEGQPYRVSSLDIAAVRIVTREGQVTQEPAELLFDKRELLDLCQLEPGQRWTRARQDRDRLALRTFYGKRGYLNHPSLPDDARWQFLEPRLVYDVDDHTVAVTYQLAQGRQLELREIRIRGTRHTRDRVVRSRISVFPGELADQDEIERSLRRIQGTGFFSDQFRRLEHPEPTYRFLPVEGDPTKVDLEYSVEEGRVVNANVAGGIDSQDGLFGIISLSMQNFDITNLPSGFGSMFREIYNKEAFHGAGQRLDLEVSPGTQLTRMRVRYFYPDIFNTDLRPVGLDVDINRRVRFFENYEEDRFSGRLRLSRRFENDVVLTGGIEYRTVDVNKTELPAPPELVRQELGGKQGFLGPLVEVSRRDVDNILIPHQGYSWRWLNQVFSEALGGDVSMAVSEGSADWYRPVRERDDGTLHVLHVGVDAGVQYPFGGQDTVPYSERYQLGGRTTLRGFEFRRVGPIDPVSRFPLGGETFLAGTVEYFVPLTSVPGPDGLTRREAIRGGLFVDYGVLDPDPFRLHPDQIRVSAGFMIGLAYPLPLQLNFGWPVVRKDGDRARVLSFSFAFN